MESKSKQVVVVFGGAGFIGRALCKRILQSNRHQVVIADDRVTSGSSTLPAELSICWHEVSAHSQLAMDSLARRFNIGDIAYVYNLVTINQELAESRPEYAAESNILAAKLITDFAIKFKVPLIYTSSASVYGNSTEVLTEDSKLHPTTLYAATKLAGEFITQRSPLWRIYRLSNVYGPGMLINSPWCGVIGKFLLANEMHKELEVTQRLGTTRDYTYIDDVVRALYPPLGCINNIFNISSGKATSLEQLVELIRAGGGASVKFMPSRPCDTVATRLVSSRKIHYEVAGWNPQIHLESGIERTRQWIQSELSLRSTAKTDAPSVEAHT